MCPIGELKMANNWRDCTLGDAIELKRGYDLPRARRNAGNVPIVSSSGITDFHSEAMVKAPGVVTGRCGTIGEVFFVDRDFWPLNTALYVRDFKGSDPRFISYLLRCVDFSSYSDKAAVPGLNRNDLHKAKVRLPPLEEQRAISHILGALDDRIANLRQTNATLEAMAQALFKSWFVDFDGVPPEDMQQSELGLIPKGWQVGTIGESFSLIMGQSPPGKTYNDEGIGLPFFQGRTDFGFRYPRNRKFCSKPTRITNSDDTLVSVRAPVGDLNMAWETCCIGRGVAAIRHRSGSRSFTYYAMRAMQDKLQQFEHTGTVFGSINKAEFEKLTVLEPPENRIEAYEEHIKPIDDAIKNNIAQSCTLINLRDTLLPKLISGKLRFHGLIHES